MAEIQLFLLPDEAVQLLNRFAVDHGAKALLIHGDMLKSGAANSEEFSQIARSLGICFLVKNDLSINAHLLQLRPRDEDWIMIDVGWKYKEHNTPVLIMTSFFAKSRGLGLKFKKWFPKYCSESDMQTGVNAAYLSENKNYPRNDIFYSEGAKQFVKNGGMWKQVKNAPLIFYPTDISLSEYLKRIKAKTN